jgi:hypothetical protein
LRAADENPPPIRPKKANMNPDDKKLSALLRQSRVSPSLPPRFQENVWRRLKDAETPTKSDWWLDALAALIVRPRFAYASVLALILAGALLGTYQGSQSVKQDAQARYVALVAPNSLH